MREVHIPNWTDEQIKELFKDFSKTLYKKDARVKRIVNKIKQNPQTLNFALIKDEEVFCPDSFMFPDKNDSLFFKRAAYFQALFDYFAFDSDSIIFKTITSNNQLVFFELLFSSNQGGWLKYEKLKTSKFNIDLTNKNYYKDKEI